MKREFIEVDIFSKAWKAMDLTDDDLKNLQKQIMADPECGDIIVHSGGARKMRFKFKDQGKSGSARVIYIDFETYKTVALIFAYPKSKIETISDKDKAAFRTLIKAIKEVL